MTRKLITLASIAILALGGTSHADGHPGVVLRPGDGFNPLSPRESLGRSSDVAWPATYTNPNLKPSEKVTLRLKEAYAKDTHSLLSAWNVSTDLHINYVLFGGGLNADFTRTSYLSSRTIAWTLFFSVDFPFEGYLEDRPDLSNDGLQSLLDLSKEGRLQDFSSSVGPWQVRSVSRRAGIMVVYKFTCIDQEEATRFRAHLDGRWKNGSVKVDIEAIQREFKGHVEFSSDAFQIGARQPDPAILATVKKDPGDMPAIRDVVLRALGESCKYSETLPVGDFQWTPLHLFKKVRDSKLTRQLGSDLANAPYVAAKLKTLYDQLNVAMDQHAMFSSLLPEHGGPQLADQGEARIRSHLLRLEEYESDILLAAEAIRAMAMGEKDRPAKQPLAFPVSPGLQSLLGEPVSRMGWASFDAEHDLDGPAPRLPQWETFFEAQLHIADLRCIRQIRLLRKASGEAATVFNTYGPAAIAEIKSRGGSTIDLGDAPATNGRQRGVPREASDNAPRGDCIAANHAAHKRHTYVARVVFIDGSHFDLSLGNALEAPTDAR